MKAQPRFDINQILGTPVEIALGQLLDRSDQTIKEFAYAMQRTTPRYRVRKTTSEAEGEKESRGTFTLAASATIPPPITAQAYKNDGQS